jgi:hypothetical protein
VLIKEESPAHEAKESPAKEAKEHERGKWLPGRGGRTHHQNKQMAGGGGNPEGGIGGMNEGRWPYREEQHMFAKGGPVLKDGVDKFYKTKDRSHLGQFLSKEDRFTGGRYPADYPRESETEEVWTKPKGVGHTDRDDAGDTKTVKPVKPQK